MTHLAAHPLLVTGVIVFVASLVRGLSGFGFSLIAAPLFTLIWEPVHAVSLSILMQVLSAVPAFLHQRRDAVWPIVRRTVLGVAVGTLPGAALLLWLPAHDARLAMAAVLLAALALLAGGFRPRKALALRHYGYVGIVAGIAQALSSAAGPPIVIALLASKDLAPIETRATLTATFFLTGTVGLIPLVSGGALHVIPLWGVLALCLPLVSGYWVGDRLFRLTQALNYRKIALVILLVAALLVLKPLMH